VLLGLAGCAAGTSTPAAQGTTRGITRTPTTAPSARPAPPVSRPPAPAPAGESGIAGITTIDNCPVRRAESPCAGTAVAARLSIMDAGTGAVVATVTSRSDGHFTVAVKPGRYLIRVLSIGAAPPHPQNPASVTVTAGHYTTVTLRFDIGIR
jgi:hypothetical protein